MLHTLKACVKFFNADLTLDGEKSRLSNFQSWLKIGYSNKDNFECDNDIFCSSRNTKVQKSLKAKKAKLDLLGLYSSTH